MKKIFYLPHFTLLIFIIGLFIPTNAFAKCNVAFKFGEDIKKIEKKFDSPIFSSEDLSIIEVPVEEVCPREKLGYSVVEFYFLFNELAAYKIVVDHYEDTPEDEKLLLFEYVKKNYGEITDNKRPKHWRGFKSWDQKNEIIAYKKMDFQGSLDEVLYVSNKKYHELFTIYESGESVGKND